MESSARTASLGVELGRVEYRALGPLTVEADGLPMKLGGPRQRMVLAILLSRVNHTVSQDALIDAVWAGEPPEAAKSTLQTYIYSLRRVLGTEAIVRQGDGYRVEAGAESFDVLAFEQLVEEGRRLLHQDPGQARSTLARALGLWFGAPYGGLESNPELVGEVGRLEELRLVAVEDRIAADLENGNHAGVVGELETLIREYPLRERLRGQHLLALYRSGRQAEALRAYQRARTYLAEELGIDPSSELRDLEQRILDQDPTLRVENEATTEDLAFLFTDVEDSTLLWEIHPALAQEALDRQDEIVTAVVEKHDGRVFKRTGDGSYAQFQHATNAVAAARDAQLQLAGADWGEIAAVKVRMAVVRGEVEVRADDCFGPVLHKAARVLDLAHGGQVLMANDIANTLEQGSSRPLGEYRLRGLSAPATLHQLSIPGLPEDFPPLRTDRPAVSLVDRNDGRTVRGYELRTPLGTGDFGVVYRAYQPSLGREVAVKVIRPEYANQVPFVRRFEREAQIVAQLEHPNILPLFDFWRDPEGAYLVMPVMRGGSLAEALKRGGWNLAPALGLLEQVGGALAYAHRKGVVHRDVKPGNVLLDEDGNAYLSDFGIATRLTDNADTPMTTSVGFVPPEELRGEPHTFRSDVFSLGALTFQLLTGVAPSQRLPLPSLDDARPGLPPELAAVVAKATSAEPADRFERVEDFLRSLRRAVGADVVAVASIDDPARSAESIRNPYKGLRAFAETDAIDFHGRAALIDELLGMVAAHNLVAVVGPSGSGKSSVVRAGLLPALRAGGVPGSRQWLITDMFPGSYPFEELEAALLRVAVDHPHDILTELLEPNGLLRVSKRILPDDDSTLLIVVDQFEELFSAVRSEATRRLFLDNLTAIASDERSRVRIVLTMRADFFYRPLEYGDFAAALGPGMVTIGPPTRDGLAQAIAAPARTVGVDLEPGLVGRIIADVEDQPGGLPLLQYALTEMFSQRRSDTLTVSGYEETGGVLGALGRRAEEIYAGLSDSGKETARQLFLRLVSVDQTSADTRRRARRSELKGLDVDQDSLDEALRSYGSFRLLSFDRDPVTRGPTVEVAHEALLHEWDRLSDWIEDERESLVLARRLSSATQEWIDAGRDPSFLLRGARLDQVAEWKDSSAVALTADEADYLASSLEQRRIDEAIARRRRRRTIMGLVTGLVVLAGLAAFALIQREEAEREARDARARQLAGESRLALSEDAELAILIGLEAVEVSRREGADPVPEAIGALQMAVQSSRLLDRMPGMAQSRSIDVAPDGSWLVAPSSEHPEHVEVIELAEQGRRTLLRGPAPSGATCGNDPSGDGVFCPTALSVDPGSGEVAVAYAIGETMITARAYPDIVFFDASTGTEIRRLTGFPRNALFAHTLDFSPDSRRLVATTWEGVFAFDRNTGDVIADIEVPYSEDSTVAPGAYWIDDDTFVFRSAEGALVRYSIATGERSEPWPLTGVETVLGTNPQRTHLAVTTPGQLVVLDLGSGELVSADANSILGFDWSPEGRQVAFSGFDPVVYVVDAVSGETVHSLPGSTNNIFAVAFLDASTVANIDGDELLTWDLSPGGPPELGSLRPQRGSQYGYQVSSDPPWLATFTTGDSFELLDTRTGESVAVLENQLVGIVPGILRVSPDFSLVGTVDKESLRSEIRRLPSMALVAEFGKCRPPFAFSPDNRKVLIAGSIPPELLIGCPDPASGETNNQVIDVETGEVLFEFSAGELPTFSAEFNFDGQFEGGRYLAWTDRSVVKLFDVQSGQQLGILEWTDVADGPDGGFLVLSFDPLGRYLVGGTASGEVWAVDVVQVVGGASMGEALIFVKEAHTAAAPAPVMSSEGLVATAGFDRRVRLWDQSGRLLVEFESDIITPVVRFSPDESILYYPDGGNIARFHLDPLELTELAESRLTRDMTLDECLRYRDPDTCSAEESEPSV